MAGSITITGKESFKDQSGDLIFVDPNKTKRPVNYWAVPRWWNKGKTVIYAGCARVDNTASGESIYIASSTAFPRLKIEFIGATQLTGGVSSASVPTSPTTGDVWIDSSVSPNVSRLYNGSTWILLHQSSSTSGGAYTFDSDHKREHINRIFVTSNLALKIGDDYAVPMRDTATDYIHKVN